MVWQHCAPLTPAQPLADTTKKIWQRTLDDIAERPLEFSSFQHTWGHSSAGRAPAWHAGGRRFDPAWLHHLFDLFDGMCAKEFYNQVLSPSSRGLGHYPFTVATGVRIPVGTPVGQAIRAAERRP